MKLELDPNIEISWRGVSYKLADLVRKNYRVDSSANGENWTPEANCDNSETANGAAEFYRTEGKQARVVVAEVTDKPKKILWTIRKTKDGKAALKAVGIYIQKRGGEFFVTVPLETGGHRISVTFIGKFYDKLAYEDVRGIYIIKDSETGKEFVGISGIGISELGSHVSGDDTIKDER